jgi:hypothetical protein
MAYIICKHDVISIIGTNPDKPERIATKAPRHKQQMLIVVKLRVLVSWWRKSFAISNFYLLTPET